MKILLTHRFFWPDTAPYALMLRTIGERLANDGHEVHVFASVPSYRSDGSQAVPKKQQIDGMNIRRIWTFQEKNRLFLFRLVNVMIYCLSLFWRILWLRPDVVTVSTFPPVIAAWGAGVASRLIGAKLIYHIQDIHPEVSKYSHGRLGGGITFKLLRSLDNQTLRCASAIIVLSQDMADTLHARGLDPLPVHVLNNFLLDDFSDTEVNIGALKKAPETTRIIFAGNLGAFQNLHLLSDGIEPCLKKHPSLELFFLGSGSEEAALKRRWKDHPQVKFAPFMPFASAKVLIGNADVGLVALSPNIHRVSYPSKVLTYLGLGLPLLVLVEPHSQLAADITTSNLGAIPASSTADEIAMALNSLIKNRASRSQIMDWYVQNASVQSACNKWSTLIRAM